MDEPGRHFAKRDEPDTERKTPREFAYMRCLKQSNSQK
jgi:hypothetical protein